MTIVKYRWCMFSLAGGEKAFVISTVARYSVDVQPSSSRLSSAIDLDCLCFITNGQPGVGGLENNVFDRQTRCLSVCKRLRRYIICTMRFCLNSRSVLTRLYAFDSAVDESGDVINCSEALTVELKLQRNWNITHTKQWLVSAKLFYSSFVSVVFRLYAPVIQTTLNVAYCCCFLLRRC